MALVPLHPFGGLNKQVGASDDEHMLSEALNVYARSDKKLYRRPALRYRALLPTDSVGLYSVGDQLRVAAPFDAGDLTADDYLAPTLSVDYFTKPAVLTVSKLLGYGIDSLGRAGVLLRMSDNSTQLHHCPPTGTWPGPSTLLAPGFTPDFGMVTTAGRWFVLDANLKYLRYSALDSPSDPTRIENFTPGTNSDDGNFLQISQFAQGSGEPQGLGTFGGRLVVFYRGAALIYRVDTDQARFYLQQSLIGPGTRSPRSAVEINDDLIFLSEAGVRSLTRASETLDAGQDAIGSQIDPLALAYADPVGVVPIGHHARRLSGYVLNFGNAGGGYTDVTYLSLLPGEKPLGWYRWRLPVVVDGMAEAQGLTWLRAGNKLYSFDETLDQDQTDVSSVADIPVLVETEPVRTPYLHIANAVATSSSEAVQVQVVADGRPGVDISGAPIGLPIVLPARSTEPARASVGKWGRQFAVRVYDAKALAGWRLDGLWIDLSDSRRT